MLDEPREDRMLLRKLHMGHGLHHILEGASQAMNCPNGGFNLTVGFFMILLWRGLGDDLSLETIIDKLSCGANRRLLVALENETLITGFTEVF